MYNESKAAKPRRAVPTIPHCISGMPSRTVAALVESFVWLRSTRSLSFGHTPAGLHHGLPASFTAKSTASEGLACRRDIEAHLLVLRCALYSVLVDLRP